MRYVDEDDEDDNEEEDEVKEEDDDECIVDVEVVLACISIGEDIFLGGPPNIEKGRIGLLNSETGADPSMLESGRAFLTNKPGGGRAAFDAEDGNATEIAFPED